MHITRSTHILLKELHCVPKNFRIYFTKTWPKIGRLILIIFVIHNSENERRLYKTAHRRQLKGQLFREAWTRRSVTSDMRRHRKTLTYLFTLKCHHTAYILNPKLDDISKVTGSQMHGECKRKRYNGWLHSEKAQKTPEQDHLRCNDWRKE